MTGGENRRSPAQKEKPAYNSHAHKFSHKIWSQYNEILLEESLEIRTKKKDNYYVGVL